MTKAGGGDAAVAAEAADLAERLRATAGLSPGARRVLRYIDANRVAALASSAADLAERIGTSDASVIRAVQAIGYRGLPELKKALALALDAEASPADDLRRTLTDVGDGPAEAIGMVLDIQQEALDRLRSPEARAAIARAVGILHGASRIVAFGIGPTGSLARYAATMLARVGRPTRALDATGLALADQMLDLGAGDALLVLAYGRAYREVAALFAEARRGRLPIVLVTDSLDETLARRADALVPVMRGRAGRVALHGATLVALEALVLGLVAIDRRRALASLDRMNDLRDAVGGPRRSPRRAG